MYGPIMTLSSALTSLGQHLSSLRSQQQQTAGQQRTVAAVSNATREQGQLLGLTDTALRELSASANQLVAMIQRIQHGGEPVTLDRRALAQALREIEQQALTQASDTAMLGARLAQLRARQTEIETSMRHLARGALPPAEGAVQPAGDRDDRKAISGPQVAVRSGQVPLLAGGPGGQRSEPARLASGQRANWLV
jgi:hypothetical protein